MQGRILTATLAVLALLSGCIQAPAFTSDDKTEVSAMTNHDLAENAAKAWNPDAKLAGLGAGELEHANDGLPADPHPGNGKAVVWTFVYLAGNQSRAFAVAADGRLVSGNDTKHREQPMEKDMAPLGEWKIDSNDAMGAAQKNETFAAIATSPNATFGEVLGRESGADAPSLWYLFAFSKEGGVLAQVDAVKGDLLLVQDFRMDFRMPNMGSYGVTAGRPDQPVVVKDKGTLDDAKPTKTLNFTLPRDGMTGVLRLQASRLVPVDGLQWTLKSPSGATVAEGTLKSPNPDASSSTKVKANEAGDYTLTLRYVDGAPVPVGAPGRGVDYQLNLVFGAETQPEG